VGHLADLDCPIVTVAVEGLLLRFVHWRDNRQVHVASAAMPSEWHELSAFINSMEPDSVARHSIVFFQDAEQLLRSHLDLLKKGFSQDRYQGIKQQLEDQRGREMATTRQMQDRINSKLYG